MLPLCMHHCWAVDHWLANLLIFIADDSKKISTKSDDTVREKSNQYTSTKQCLETAKTVKFCSHFTERHFLFASFAVTAVLG